MSEEGGPKKSDTKPEENHETDLQEPLESRYEEAKVTHEIAAGPIFMEE